MTEQGWRECVLNAVMEHEEGRDHALDLLVKLLAEADDAKHRLRELGYGWTGLPWPGVIDQIEEIAGSGWR